jgi:thiosulfate dehydrogenase (quinone) large subunit
MRPTPDRPDRANQPKPVSRAQPNARPVPVAHPSRPAGQVQPKVQPSSLPQPAPGESVEHRGLQASWALLPLRLFLGITFIYAGIQKFADPQYFNQAASGYIGKQVAAMAIGSPLHGFLLTVAVPHAIIFGALVACGEIAIGLGILFGLLFRVAAIFGFLLNLVFFLSATWHVYPYFYGSDIVFMFCWLTMLIAGPANTGVSALIDWIMNRLPQEERQQWASALAYFRGSSAPSPTAPATSQSQAVNNRRQAQRYAQAQRAQKQSRRSFIWGAVAGGAGIAAIIWVWNFLNATSAPATTGGASPGATPATGTATSSGSSSVIAQISQVPDNSSAQFTLTSNGDPGVLVHLSNGQFVAYDAVCTHAGCPVSYDPSSHLLECPCHGAAFDPAKNGAVVQGPALTPLASVKITVDNAKGTISQ